MSSGPVRISLREAWLYSPSAFVLAIAGKPTDELRRLHAEVPGADGEYGLALALAIAERDDAALRELLVVYEAQRWRWTRAGHGGLRAKVADALARAPAEDLLALAREGDLGSEETRGVLAEAIRAKLERATVSVEG